MVVLFSRFVSIQLISPASGEPKNLKSLTLILLVSIQLISPASGEFAQAREFMLKFSPICFHSINFPSEWGAAA